MPHRWYLISLFLLILGGCGTKPDCNSMETRSEVLRIVSDDHDNRLGHFAAENSNLDKSDLNKSNSSTTPPESARPLYLLGERIVTTSVSKDKRTLQCSGAISATVGNAKASKEITFTVQQATDGKISVSVAPFEF